MDTDELVKKAFRFSRRALRIDRIRVRKRLRSITSGKVRLSGKALDAELSRLMHRLERSAALRTERYGRFPMDLPAPPLPIVEKQDAIVDAIRENPVIIVSGATGSGKSTQLPKYCVMAGCGKDGRVGCTQPRRIAAVSVARRIAQELGGAGETLVGYKIRFADRTSRQSLIKVMTDGILLAEAHNDPFLNEYDAIVVDEAHERSLNIDFLLGILRRLLSKRHDLRVVITSATIDTEKFASSFPGAPVIEVSGRMYPVEVRYMPPVEDDRDYLTCAEQAADAVDAICRRDPFGDILVFMPTARDIRDTCDMIEGRRYPGVTVMPLFARLSGADQARVFSRPAGRKVIVATNIAETSLTIPGIRYVVDTGLARISYYNPRTGTTSLSVRPISKSSCMQRTGRCGRMENGVCIRLYDEKEFESRPMFTPPEIVRANLADVILRMMALKLGDVDRFPFVDPPKPRSIRDGYETLVELGAIRRSKGRQKKYSLTGTGRIMARIPVDPRLARILIEAGKNGCIEPATVIVCALGMQDPREFPAGKENEAREAHAKFADSRSDFITLLNIWDSCSGMGRSSLKRFCMDNYLSFRRIREWQDLCSQVEEIINEHGLADKSVAPADRTADPEGFYEALHKAVLCGYLSNMAEKKNENIYVSAKSGEVMIFPGSSLFGAGHQLIVAAEFVETSRLYARMAAAIQRKWIAPVAGDLCRRTFLNPRWSRSRGQVVADCRTTVFGIVADYTESVPYGPVNPAEASDIFIRCALVNGDVDYPLPFMKHNARLAGEAKKTEDRLRQRGLVADEDALFLFYKKRLGSRVCDIRTLQKEIDEKKDRFLKMTMQDVLPGKVDTGRLALFPESIKLGDENFYCSYKFDPASEMDGVTVHIPASMASDVPVYELDWLVPGLLEEKIAALIKGLPKEYRKLLVPVSRTVNIIMDEMPRGGRPLLSALSMFMAQRFGVDIPASAWRPEALPPYLLMRIAITDETGRPVKISRDCGILRRAGFGSGKIALPEPLKHRWEVSGQTTWEFPDLPEMVEEETGGKTYRFYPGLADRGDTVDLCLFANRSAAVESHVAGVKRLLLLSLPGQARRLERDLALSGRCASAAVLLGGAKNLEKQMANRVMDDLLRLNIRTAEEFGSCLKKVPGLMQERAARLKEACSNVVLELHETLMLIQELESALCRGGETAAALAGIRKALSSLVPDSFVMVYDLDGLRRLVRYIRAAGIRARRAVEDIEREKRKALRVKWAEDSLLEVVDSLSRNTSEEKRQEVEEFFWMVEEYKVSVFAQELGTSLPVSEKRLAEKLKRIRAMV
ncbi:MAG: ATP-dependent RNA helicase HrpA [Desulfococcus sp. 4484_241]|nr:MAG: ATP-dependent RNA helicase HrpA [Desulfococcus sp. 4484_241]